MKQETDTPTRTAWTTETGSARRSWFSSWSQTGTRELRGTSGRWRGRPGRSMWASPTWPSPLSRTYSPGRVSSTSSRSGRWQHHHLLHTFLSSFPPIPHYSCSMQSTNFSTINWKFCLFLSKRAMIFARKKMFFFLIYFHFDVWTFSKGPTTTQKTGGSGKIITSSSLKIDL